MNVHFFTRADIRGPDSRQRAFQIVDKLNVHGISATIQQPPDLLFSLTPWPRKSSLFVSLIRSLSRIKKGDVVYLQRTVSNKYFFIVMVAYLFLFRRKMVFDFCDPVYVVNPIKAKLLTRMADAVIVSSHKQETWARQYNSNVHLIHISLDFPVYKKFTKDYSSSHGPLTIGWIGTAHNHMLNLEILASVFKKLLLITSIPFTFVLIGAFKNQKVYELFQQIEGLDIRFTDELDYADPESAPKEIQKFDIGVVPQIDETEWNKAKTSMKILEYMACGVATVASVSGELPYIIKDGVNGYLASNEDEDEWAKKLALLLEDRVLRERFGRAGQETVKERYSFATAVPEVAEVIRSTL